ncbi:MAG TPA: sensor histidine kinase, partial [Pararobbsia sp.]|nr:sensor histidine kinase [Pararobbsia sp.]
IARELHDDLGQQLVALKMEVSDLHKSLVTKNSTHSDLERITRFVTRIDAIISSVRRIAADLRPPLLDDLGLTAAIEWIASDTERRHGFSVVHDLDIGDLAMDGRAASSMFRVVQEALNNSVRHAHAGQVEIRLFVESDHLLLQIHDDGVGIELADSRKPTSFGLLGMGERVHMLGGKITFHSRPGSGFSVDVSIPLANVAVRAPSHSSF